MTAIDVGPGATDRAAQVSAQYTSVELGNPADGTGNIDTALFWAHANITGMKVGMVYTTAVNKYKCRSVVSIGNVTAGSQQSFTGLTMAVTLADYVATYFATGSLDAITTGGSGEPYKAGDQLTVDNDQTYTADTSFAGSVYCTGTTSGGGGWANIKNIRVGTGTITATDLSSIWFGTTEVAVADVAELGGVAV